jgi:hypothetical protein
MEDYTFKYLKRPQDFIVRIISDFLPHETEIDFFEEVKGIDFLEGVKAVDDYLNVDNTNAMQRCFIDFYKTKNTNISAGVFYIEIKLFLQ